MLAENRCEGKEGEKPVPRSTALVGRRDDRPSAPRRPPQGNWVWATERKTLARTENDPVTILPSPSIVFIIENPASCSILDIDGICCRADAEKKNNSQVKSTDLISVALRLRSKPIAGKF